MLSTFLFSAEFWVTYQCHLYHLEYIASMQFSKYTSMQFSKYTGMTSLLAVKEVSLVQWLSSQEMEPVAQVQILDEAGRTHVLEKGMDPSVPLPDISK